MIFAIGFLGISTALPGKSKADPTLFYGFSQQTTWLVAMAIYLAAAVDSSGLGRRISLIVLSKCGSSLMGVAYSLCCLELLIGPFVPSNTARGSGIILPIVKTLTATIPEPTRPFIVLVAAHANLISAGMFLTAMSANQQVPLAPLTIPIQELPLNAVTAGRGLR